MATIPLKRIETPLDGWIKLYQWTGLTKTTDDVGEPLILPHYADKTVHVKGTWGEAGSLVIEGSNDKDSPAYATLNDPQGNALSITADKIETILEDVYWLRPRVTGGDVTTSLTVTVLAKA